MLIAELGAKNFRGLKEFHLEVDKPSLVVTGSNGSGKTSLLEVIYLLCTVHSFRTHELSQLINHNENALRAFGVFGRADDKESVEVEISQTAAKCTLEGQQRDSLELVSKFPCTTFTQEDVSLVLGSPRQKRLVIDRVLCVFNSEFSRAYRQYFRALKQRNTALKIGQSDVAELYNPSLAKYGLIIKNQRKDFLEKLSVQLKNYEGLEKQEIIYYSDWKNLETEAEILENLQLRAQADIKKQKTSLGVQQDDFGFFSCGKNSEFYYSQGQIKYLSLCLKDSINTLFIAKTGQQPILLIDDVLLDLDQEHRNRIIEYISRHENTQTFWTFLDCQSNALYENAIIVKLNDGSVNVERR